MKLVKRGLALLLAASLMIPTLPVRAEELPTGGDTSIEQSIENENVNDDSTENINDDLVQSLEEEVEEETLEEAVEEETSEKLVEEEVEEETSEELVEEEVEEETSRETSEENVEDALIPDRAVEVKFNTGNYEFSIVDLAVSEEAVGDGIFNEDGSFIINIPEENPFFPYEVQFTCDGEVTTEWFMTPDDSVEIGGHMFYVSAYMDGTAVTQLTLNVAGKDVIVYPQRKEFTNDSNGVMPISLLPLETVDLSSVDLTDFTPVELTHVSVTSIMGNNVAGAQNIVWRYEGTDGEYIISSINDTIDLSYQTCSGGTTWEMIVGSPDQLDDNNIRYRVRINVTDSSQWLSPQVYIKNTNGTKSQATVNNTYYSDYSREYREYDVYASTNTSIANLSNVYLKLGINEAVYARPTYDSFKVFVGNYTDVSETAGAVDITTQICSEEGFGVGSYNYTWLTMVTYDSAGNVTGCLPFELYVGVSFSSESSTPTTYSYISTSVLRKKDDMGNMESISSYGNYDSEIGCNEYDIDRSYSVDGNYYWKLTYMENGIENNESVTAAYVGKFSSIAAAEAAGASEVKNTLFGSEGYLADYSQGIVFTIFVGNDGEANRKVFYEGAKAVVVLESGRNVNFTGLKDANGTDIPYYIVETYKDPFYGYSTGDYNDSYGEYNFFTMLVDSSVDLSQELAPEFSLSTGAKLYTAGSNTEEVSGVSKHLFNAGAIQYTCSAEDGENSRNYWLQILTAEAGGKLYINSLEDEMSETREENGVIYSTREIMLDGYHDYIHDILVVNKGMESIPGLSVELESDVVELDEYWTLKGTHELKGFRKITSYRGEDELSNQAKIRIKAKEGISANEVAGTLTIKSNGNTLMVLNLTGTLGDPTIITEDIPEAVKYVPYGTMIQNNNKYSWNKITYKLVNGSGRLPNGMTVKPNGEIYGVPQETGTFTFTVLMDNSGEFKDSTATFTLNVIENTDVNVDNATDEGYDLSQRIQNIHVNTSDMNGEQTVVSEGVFGEFVDLYLDGVKLVKDTDYTAESGSTRITIMNQTLVQGGNGTHTLGIEFRTQDDVAVLKRAAQNYVVTSNGSSSGGNSGNTGTGGGTDNNFDYNSDSSSTPNVFENLTIQLKENAENNKTNMVSTTSYIIQPGDTLWKIAVKYYGDGNQWRKILEDNKAVIKDPNRIYVGQAIIINVVSNNTETKVSNKTNIESIDGSYTVKEGDTLWKISKKVYGTGIFWRRIFDANKDTITDASRIYVGQKIKMP